MTGLGLCPAGRDTERKVSCLQVEASFSGPLEQAVLTAGWTDVPIAGGEAGAGGECQYEEGRVRSCGGTSAVTRRWVWRERAA